ncbi:haloacid dehalogenase-like hydrolase [Bacteriovorax sp. BSW11_IV]|uniref:HAD family hydrolase n=1 Tax=Bacteriovorax sp. BSW11_IV TaxID=1353529 RepID=UPI000389E6CB|nr:HAD family phosphatase [Bacteriovorax sp. BSW11_IV]EQC45873.1 haloacid dehalogenase-like hydrolase [Bacteriovorax sp. BSW11_IV]
MISKKGIIFDLDGVLWNSSSAHENSFKSVLAQFEITNFNYHGYAGMRTDEVFKETLSKNNISFDDNMIMSLTEKKRSLATNLLNESDFIYKDTCSSIKDLNKKFKLCIASSSRSKNIELFLKKSGLTECFAFYISGEDVQNAKPSPEIYNLAAKMMKIPKENLVVIEDSFSGIKASLAAEIETVAITTAHKREELKKLSPHKIIDSLSEIVSIYE